jgi:hypothetical protein
VFFARPRAKAICPEKRRLLIASDAPRIRIGASKMPDAVSA